MDFVTAVKSCLSKYASFKGRAPRSEYWFFYLFWMLVYIVAMIVDGVLGFPILTLVSMFGLLVPMLAVSVRRLHDTDRSGWWMFIGLVPVVGGILLLIWNCSRGTAGDNQFGADPLSAGLAPAAA
ncbi:MAG TPA: DUF805 domain-containing protein [Magnetospirillum sp.]|nr:DUF805 domain-containing protein [Magnetospirillum sp.]